MLNRINTTLVILLLGLIIPKLTYTQNQPFYYYDGEKVNLTLDYSKLNITVASNFQTSSLAALGFHNIELVHSNSWWVPSSIKNHKIEFMVTPTPLAYETKIQALKNLSGIVAVSPYTGSNASNSIGFSNIFHIKLNQLGDTNTLKTDVANKNLIILEQDKFMPLWYTVSLTVTSTLNALEACNFFYETGSYAGVDPSFMFKVSTSCTNDIDFNKLWGLKNTTNPGMDIKACDAWTLSTGFGVNVTVVDRGIELTHQDLSPNISSKSFDTHSRKPPSLAYADHGSHVGGIIGAVKDNNLQVVGVAPRCTLQSVSNAMDQSMTGKDLAAGINWAWQNGADIINNSWFLPVTARSLALEDAIDDALTKGRGGKGTVVVFASGNHSGGQPGNVVYPAYYHDDILVVGSIDSDGKRSSFSNKGPQLDLVAPGNQIYSTIKNNSTSYISGTSMAAPHVSGVAALMLSVNPKLTVKQVNNIIESTAQKVGNYTYQNLSSRPNGTWNGDMGYGLLNAHKAVEEATKVNPVPDLFVGDTPNDEGFVPGYPWSNINTVFSPNIWLRNQQDGLTNQTSQTPIYNQNSTMYAYVRVKNRGYASSLGTEKLALYWSRAAANHKWPGQWNGTQPTVGNQISSLTIPVLNPGDETILEFTWNLPTPIPNAGWVWPASLLARVENSNLDPITAYPANLAKEVYYNNNISLKDFVVFNYVVQAGGGSGSSQHQQMLLVGNTLNQSASLDVILKNPDGTPNEVTNVAEVNIQLDQQGWGILASHLQGRPDIEMKEDNTFTIIGNQPVVLSGVNFPADTRVPLILSFNFLTEEVGAQIETYNYEVAQKYHTPDPDLGDNWTGGIHLIINKGTRDLFDANAGMDEEILQGQSVTLSASQLSETAQYNWYDMSGKLVYTGANLSVSPDVTQKYKLEIIAGADGFKDYDEVEVKVKEYFLSTISPNPASGQVTISYKADSASSAYLMIVSTSNTSSINNYLLNSTQNQTTVNVSGYVKGTYKVGLIIDGKLEDIKTLVVQ